MKISFKDLEKQIRKMAGGDTALLFIENHYAFYRNMGLTDVKIKKRYGKKIFTSYPVAFGNSCHGFEIKGGTKLWLDLAGALMKLQDRLDEENTRKICKMIRRENEGNEQFWLFACTGDGTVYEEGRKIQQ